MGNDGVVIRSVAAGELTGFLPLIRAYQQFYGGTGDDERNTAFFSRFLAPSPHGELLGGWVDGTPAGFATLYWTFSSVSAVDVVLLNDLFVSHDRRGFGIGRALLQAAAGVAARRGAARLEWATAPENSTARRLYDALGAHSSDWVHYEQPV